MKKLLAVLLTLTMLVTLPAFSASAEEGTRVVGEGNGAEDFAPTTTGGQDLNVKVSEVNHRYAVDITFDLSALTIGGTITWNVKDLKYDVEGALTGEQERFVTVSNRSDLDVYAYAAISEEDANDGITVSTTNIEGNKLTVPKAKAGSGTTAGTPTDKNIKISITSNDWGASTAYYAAKKLNDINGTDTFKIATVTVTITKNA